MESIGEKNVQSLLQRRQLKKKAERYRVVIVVRAAYARSLVVGLQRTSRASEPCNKAFAASPQVLIERSMKG